MEYSKRYIKNGMLGTLWGAAAIVGAVAGAYFFSSNSIPVLNFYCSTSSKFWLSANIACPLYLAVLYVFLLAVIVSVIPLVVTVLFDVLISIINFIKNRPSPNAKINFKIPSITNREILLEVINNETRLSINELKIEMLRVEPLEDRRGYQPETDDSYLESWNELLTRRSHGADRDNYLKRKEGGSVMAEGLMVNPKTKVIFYLFKIEHGVFWWDTDRIDKAGFCNFDNGRYKFSLKFHGYVEYKEGPYAVDIVVDFQGGDIINADIYDEDTE